MADKVPEDVSKYQSNYSESGFWSVVKKIGGKVLTPALKLYYVLKKDDVDSSKKALIIGALGYLILPVDLVPDFLPVVGYSDDLAALLGTLKMVSDEVDSKVIEQVEETKRDLLG
ncbi:MAG: DUF1232 domain-containing protein [Paludibacteraceae bacterium]|nr:DUF1232 domain-containing protein [Paludibacteraceae bacterium]